MAGREVPYAVAGSVRWYLDLSQRPLQVLLFLAPLIVVYEIGTWVYATQPGTGAFITITAHKLLGDVYQVFGVTGLHLPAVTLVVVLLLWHILLRQKWELHLGVPVVMLLESIVMAFPLLVLDQLIRRLAGTSGTTAMGTPFWEWWALASPSGSGGAAAALAELPRELKLVLSIGAGLYEELLFRMVLIALAHTVLVDVLGVSVKRGSIAAVLIAAAAFTAYHDLSGPGGVGIDPHRVAFFLGAGLYFAGLYVTRGFGIVVGAHAMYDVLVMVILPPLARYPTA